jgi:two-component system, NtrC family, sensor histidine kinase HydH
VSGADDLRRAPLPPDLDRLLHDLRGPLNAAVMHLEVLKRLGSDDATVRSSLQSIQQEFERFTAMLPVAFSICAVELGPVRRVLLRSVVESAIDETARKRVDVDPGPWPEIDGDERLLVMAMRHVIQNALEASDDEGAVHVSVEPGDGDTVAVVVRDAGKGFKTRNPNAIVRLMATTKAGHVGIGLLVAQRIARLHGGTLTFETVPGDGGVVRVTLRAP